MLPISAPYANLVTLPWEEVEKISNEIESLNYSSFIEILQKQGLVKDQATGDEILRNLARAGKDLCLTQSLQELSRTITPTNSQIEVLWKAAKSILDSIVDSFLVLFHGEVRTTFEAGQRLSILGQLLTGSVLILISLTGTLGSPVIAFLYTTLIVIAVATPILLYARFRSMPETYLGFQNLTIRNKQNTAPLFINRTEIMSQLQAFLHRGKHVLIVGNSGVGKTSLIHELARCHIPKFRYVFCGGVHHFRPDMMTPHNKFRNLQNRIGSEEEATIVAVDEIHGVTTDEVLKKDFLELSDRTARAAKCTFIGLTTPEGYEELQKIIGWQRRWQVINLTSADEAIGVRIFERYMQSLAPEIAIEKGALEVLYKADIAQPGKGIAILDKAVVVLKTRVSQLQKQYEKAEQNYFKVLGLFHEEGTQENSLKMTQALATMTTAEQTKNQEAELLEKICELRKKLFFQKQEMYRDAEVIEAGAKDSRLKKRVLFKNFVMNPALRKEIEKAEDALRVFRRQHEIQENEGAQADEKEAAQADRKEAAQRPLLLTKDVLSSIRRI